MARPKKDGTYLNVKIQTDVYNRLENFKEKSGQTKTFIVEKALTSYMDDYDEKEKLLGELKK